MWYFGAKQKSDKSDSITVIMPEIADLCFIIIMCTFLFVFWLNRFISWIIDKSIKEIIFDLKGDTKKQQQPHIPFVSSWHEIFLWIDFSVEMWMEKKWWLWRVCVDKLGGSVYDEWIIYLQNQSNSKIPQR